MNLERKCRLCGSDLYVLLFKNKAGIKQQGLYCSKCGKYHKFLTNNEVLYAVGIGMKLKNTYGELENTKLRQLNRRF